MTIRAGFFGKTSKFAVSSAEADDVTIEGTPESKHAFLIQSDQTVYLTRDGTDASIDTGLRIPANTIVLINTYAGDVVSYIGEADGSIWLTQVDH